MNAASVTLLLPTYLVFSGLYLALGIQLAFWIFVLRRAYQERNYTFEASSEPLQAGNARSIVSGGSLSRSIAGPGGESRRRQFYEQPPVDLPPVSVIVCFHNEAERLAACVESILRQEYAGDFELLLVDDNSTDASLAIAQTFERERTAGQPKIRVLQPGPTGPGKKDALRFGVTHATHDLLLLTDADCRVRGSDWLATMTKPLNHGKSLVLGVSLYDAGNDYDFLAEWQRYESTYVSLKYLGFARRGMPYMGVGRNLAYTRDFFERAGALRHHADLPSGDDDLLIAGNATAAETALVTVHAARVDTFPLSDWRDYFNQRRRHQTTGTRYPLKTSILLTLLAVSHGTFFLFGFLALFAPYLGLALLVYAIRIFIVYLVITRPYATRRTTEERDRVNWKRLSYVPFFDAALAPMYLYLTVSALFPRRAW